MPVGYDRDGAVASLYRVGGCPTFAYVYPGGDPAERQHRRPDRRLSSSDRVESCCGRPEPRSGSAEMAGAEAAGERIGWEPSPEQGWVAPHVAAEFPGLGIAWVEVDARPGKSPEPVRRRLRDLSDRFYGAHAIHMRERPIPWAYRVFFRQIGLDPDRTRTPVERARAGAPPRRRLQEPRPARRRADDRHRRDRDRAARLRRRAAPGRPLHPRLGARASRWPAGPASWRRERW